MNDVLSYLVIAVTVSTAASVFLMPFVYRRKYNPGYLVISPIILITITSFFIHKATHSLSLTLAASLLAGIYHLFVEDLLIRRRNKKASGAEQINKGPVWLRLASMVIIAGGSGYAGYVLSGGYTSFLIITGWILLSFLLLAFLGWWQSGRNKSDSNQIKSRVEKRMNELNTQAD
jgi:hypothetical protein